jgi:hypothetical protein
MSQIAKGPFRTRYRKNKRLRQIAKGGGLGSKWTGLKSSTVTGNEGSVMRNPIDIDQTHTQAIRQEIGEGLRVCLGMEPELPTNLRKQVNLLHELEGQSPSIVPDVEQGSETGQNRSRFIWPWRRKT